jgi:hypothetical protein
MVGSAHKDGIHGKQFHRSHQRKHERTCTCRSSSVCRRHSTTVALPPQQRNRTASALDPSYLASRKQPAEISSQQPSTGTAQSRRLLECSGDKDDHTSEVTEPPIFSLIDRAGNVVVMTSTIESGMGWFHFTRGFLLNDPELRPEAFFLPAHGCQWSDNPQTDSNH